MYQTDIKFECLYDYFRLVDHYEKNKPKEKAEEWSQQ